MTKKRIIIITDELELIEYANFSILKVEHSSSFINKKYQSLSRNYYGKELIKTFTQMNH